MKISFPITKFSHVYDIICDLFELDINNQENSFEFSINGIHLKCFLIPSIETWENISSVMPTVVELSYDHYSYQEISKRLALYCYRHHIQPQDLAIDLFDEKFLLIWKICPLLHLEFHFKNQQEIFAN